VSLTQQSLAPARVENDYLHRAGMFTDLECTHSISRQYYRHDFMLEDGFVNGA